MSLVATIPASSYGGQLITAYVEGAHRQLRMPPGMQHGQMINVYRQQQYVTALQNGGFAFQLRNPYSGYHEDVIVPYGLHYGQTFLHNWYYVQASAPAPPAALAPSTAAAPAAAEPPAKRPRRETAKERKERLMKEEQRDAEKKMRDLCSEPADVLNPRACDAAIRKAEKLGVSKAKVDAARKQLEKAEKAIAFKEALQRVEKKAEPHAHKLCIKELQQALKAAEELQLDSRKLKSAKTKLAEAQRAQRVPKWAEVGPYPELVLGLVDAEPNLDMRKGGLPTKYAANELPEGLKIHATTGRITGTASQLSMLSVVASNASGSASTDRFCIRLLGEHARHWLSTSAHAAFEAAARAPTAPLANKPDAHPKWEHVIEAAQALRTGKFDFYAAPAGQSYSAEIFDTLVENEEQYCHCRALAGLACVSLSGQEEEANAAAKMLDEGESHLKAYSARLTDKAKVEPLFLLAAARLKSAQDDHEIAAQLMRAFTLFDNQLPEESRWFGATQCQSACWRWDDKAIRDHKSGAAGATSSSAGASGRSATTAALDKDSSNAYARWVALNRTSRAGPKVSALMDELFSMVGLEAVKAEAVDMYTKVVRDLQLPAAARIPNTLNFVFLGNPGTGKTTMARLFGKLLHEVGARASDAFVELKAQQALSIGEEAFNDLLHLILNPTEEDDDDPMQASMQTPAQKKAATLLKKCMKGQAPNGEPGGVLFIDEAHMLDPKTNPVGKAIFNYIMDAAEDSRSVLTIILAGYKNDVEQKLYAFNVGLKSRFDDIIFKDYGERELRQIWDKLLTSYSDATLRIAWTAKDDVSMVAVRRVARGKDRPGFGNGRDLRNAFETAAKRAQARSDFNIKKPTLKMEDVIGPEPTEGNNEDLRSALADLREMEGLDEVKEAVATLVDINLKNYWREIRGDKVLDLKKNRIFWGNPGTGKSTMAQIYGRVMRALRLLSNGEVVMKTASDFIGSVVGESAEKTATILGLCKGKVLVIDEAYNLDDNMYGKQALDTIVEKISGDASEDIAIIMAGYEREMRKMLREQNAGLSSRFDPDSAFHFVDYDDSALARIFRRKLARRGLLAHRSVIRAMVTRLARKRELPNFGNARDVETLISTAQAKAMRRTAAGSITLELSDVKAEGGDDDDPMSALQSLYKVERIRDEIVRLQKSIQVARADGLPGPKLSSYCFVGNSGTGKTTVARTMAKVFSVSGTALLARDHVEEVSASELKGAYIGKAQENVSKAMEAARGGVLFVDEAYTLGDGPYGKEALDSLVDLMTKPDYLKTMVILAGYKTDLNAMLAGNQGARSRFTTWEFEDWSAEDCAGCACKRAQADGLEMDESSPAFQTLLHGFERLRWYIDEGGGKHTRCGWANARDVGTVYEKMLQTRAERVYDHGLSGGRPRFEVEDVDKAIEMMLLHRPDGVSLSSERGDSGSAQAQHQQQAGGAPALHHRLRSERRQAAAPAAADVPADEPMGDVDVAGVRAAFLAAGMEERARIVQETEARNNVEEMRQLRLAVEEAARREAEAGAARSKAAAAEQAAAAQAAEEARKAEEALRQQAEAARQVRLQQELMQQAEEQARIAEERRRAEQEAAARRLREEQARLEEARQQRLREVGPCPVGFRYIKCHGGYQCEGGGHFVSDAEVDNL